MSKVLRMFLLSFLLFGLCANAVLGSEIEQSVGIGAGLPFGGFGLNYEASFCDYFAPTLGIGILPDNVGWNIGGRIYYPSRSEKVRGRVSLLYGTNVLLEKRNGGDSDYETDEGFSIGGGVNWRFHEKWAFDGDIFFVTTDISDEYDQEGGDAVLSIGFSRRW